ncbi:MAG TPA: hypothetical protein VFO18_16720 [Methylomirabilota bacterium]|nr:hypothetical protein [Methylomirabilota bacterium]
MRLTAWASGSGAGAASAGCFLKLAAPILLVFRLSVRASLGDLLPADKK